MHGESGECMSSRTGIFSTLGFKGSNSFLYAQIKYPEGFWKPRSQHEAVQVDEGESRPKQAQEET
jgi:hypothetical protein